MSITQIMIYLRSHAEGQLMRKLALSVSSQIHIALLEGPYCFSRFNRFLSLTIGHLALHILWNIYCEPMKENEDIHLIVNYIAKFSVTNIFIFEPLHQMYSLIVMFFIVTDYTFDEDYIKTENILHKRVIWEYSQVMWSRLYLLICVALVCAFHVHAIVVPFPIGPGTANHFKVLLHFKWKYRSQE